MSPRGTLIWLLSLLMVGTLVACGGGNNPPAAQSPAPSAPTSAAAAPTNTPAARPATTPAGGQATSAPGPSAPPSPTPNNLVPTAAAGAPNTSFQTARAIGKDPIDFGVKESEFYYKIDIARGGIVSATLTVKAGSPQPARLTLYDETQQYLNEIAVPVGKSGLLRYIFNAKGGGTVFLAVAGESNVSLSAQALAQNDGGSKGDAGDDLSKPATVAFGSITGVLGDADNKDHYLFEVPKMGGTLTLGAKTTDGSVQVTVYNDQQGWIMEVASDRNKPEQATATHVLANGQGGRWFVAVLGEGNYTISLAFAAQNDGGSGKDAGTEMAGAVTATSADISGLLGGNDSDDYYKIPAAMGRKVTVKFVKGEGTLQIVLYGNKGEYSGDADANVGESVELTEATVGSNDYYVHVRGASGEYTIKISK